MPASSRNWFPCPRTSKPESNLGDATESSKKRDGQGNAGIVSATRCEAILAGLLRRWGPLSGRCGKPCTAWVVSSFTEPEELEGDPSPEHGVNPGRGERGQLAFQAPALLRDRLLRLNDGCRRSSLAETPSMRGTRAVTATGRGGGSGTDFELTRIEIGAFAGIRSSWRLLTSSKTECLYRPATLG